MDLQNQLPPNDSYAVYQVSLSVIFLMPYASALLSSKIKADLKVSVALDSHL